MASRSELRSDERDARGLAVGYLERVGGQPYAYFNPDARLNHLRTLITDNREELGATVSLGLEFALLPLSGNVVQTSLGLRGGYQMSLRDRAGFEGCDEAEAYSDSRFCSQPVVQVPLNLSLLERVRLTATPLLFPMKQGWGHQVVDLDLAIGAEFF